MDRQDSFESPLENKSDRLSEKVVGTVRTTRRILWALIGLCVLTVLYSIVECVGILWAAQFFDNSGGAYTSLALLRLSKIPFACILAWQFFCFDQAMATVVTDGRLDLLLLAQKTLLVLLLASVAYFAIQLVGTHAVASFAS